ncbi:MULTISPECIES: avidin/streptavidin family protein [Dickeya]|uniref:Avidin/streptavidin family protein n=1 Tax=Dickeya solani TaxID=1089444 RepID=A0AAX4F402_9GAMM|nr:MULTISPECIES: avidin/streptavidin family protein [Dickeya]MCA7001459.1 avidin/streptavidin family protein [Dickeya solani]MCZ0820898.1 avidin/streptavidin family protein [Dickeya solani]MDV6996834.1 avidin/streptavidin family protein [Dickeya solani]MDV7002694.1 avidin/streptavidin family protein [Dickeya solani]MDV7038656.1 avidin/streptavidin family protein [Dickeya solani]
MHQENALAIAKVGSGLVVDFSGNWKNELGSTVILQQNNNTLSGTYVSAVSNSGTSTIGDLVGYVDGDLIAFVVHWRDFQAITSWVGQLAPGSSPDTIKTLWQMTSQVNPGNEWASINAGADDFVREVI